MNYLDIARLITDGKIFDAIEQIRILISPNSPHLGKQLEELAHTYEQSIIYYIKGIEDRDRPKILIWLREQLLGIAVEADYQRTRLSSQSLYYHYRSDITSIGEEVDYLLSLDISHDNTLAIERLFKHLWITQELSANDRVALLRFANPYEQGLVISAITLALDFYPTRSHLLYLINALHHYRDVPEIRVRVIVALVLVSHYSWSPILTDSLRYELDQLFDLDCALASDLAQASLLLCRARATSQVSRQIQNDLYNQWNKIPSEIRQHLNKIADDDVSPKIYDKIKQAGLEAGVQNAFKKLSSGEDIFFDQFAQLKAHPYYQRLSAWFMPLSERNTLYQKIEKLHPQLIRSVQDLRPSLCESDLYTMLLVADNLSSLPHLSDWMLHLPTLPTSKNYTLRMRLGHYIADLYRFCKLYGRKSEHTDYFNYEYSPSHNDSLIMRYTSEGYLEQLAQLCLSQKRTIETIKLYEQLTNINPTKAEYYDQLGILLIHEQQWKEAIKVFDRANLINECPNRSLNLARCYSSIGEYTRAIKLLRSTTFMQGSQEQDSALIAIAHNLMLMSQWAEALETGFQCEVIYHESIHTRRIVSFCLLQLGRTSEAEAVYEEMRSKYQLSPSDWFNMGHSALKLGQGDRAISYYQNTLSILGMDLFIQEWNKEERGILENLGIDPGLIDALQEYMLHLNDKGIDGI